MSPESERTEGCDTNDTLPNNKTPQTAFTEYLLHESRGFKRESSEDPDLFSQDYGNLKQGLCQRATLSEKLN